MKRDILLIEGDNDQRVALVRSLTGASYRVTLCSSLKEADEVLHYVDCPEAGPNIVVFGGGVAGLAAARYEKALVKRFGQIRIIRLPCRCEPAMLLSMLGGDIEEHAAPRQNPQAAWHRHRVPAIARRRSRRSLSLIVIEAKWTKRVAIEDGLRLRGDDVVGCDSVRDAAVVFDQLAAQGLPVDAILSAPDALDGEGLQFCLSATKRKPNLRWIFIGEKVPVGELQAS
jgi:hypothetical protein